MAAPGRFRAYAAVVLFLTLVSTATAQYSGGMGEPNDPYQMATAADLITLGETPKGYDKHFLLTADIDLDPNLPGRKVFDKAVIAPDTDPWTDGFQGTPFTGEFDGNGHTISHLTIQGRAYVGLFGCLESDAKVKDLGVVDVKVSGDYPVGGLVGHNRFGSVTQCHSTGTVSGEAFVGGLVGENAPEPKGFISHSYSTGAVSANDAVGGLAGSSGGTVSCSYSTGPVTGRGQYIGGLVGCPSAFSGFYPPGQVPGDVSNSFWDTQTSDQASSAGGTGKTTAEMQTAGMFLDAGWDFVGETANGTEDIWWILEGKDYPRLWWEAGDEASRF